MRHRGFALFSNSPWVEISIGRTSFSMDSTTYHQITRFTTRQGVEIVLFLDSNGVALSGAYAKELLSSGFKFPGDNPGSPRGLCAYVCLEVRTNEDALWVNGEKVWDNKIVRNNLKASTSSEQQSETLAQASTKTMSPTRR